MAVRASVTVTISCYRDTESITRYYKLQSSTADPPGKPTVKPPSGWTDTEPAYNSGSTNTLYFVDLMVFSDGTWSYSEVSKSSSYEAAKEAYNKAQNAQDTANDANDKIDNLEIGGRNLLPNSKNLADFVVEKESAVSWEVGEESSKLTRLTSSTYYGIYYFVNVEPSTTYTFSFEVVELSSTTSCQYAIGANSGWTDLVARTTITSTGKQIVTFTAGSSTTKIRLYFCITLQNAYMTLKNAQLEKGDKATDWTPAIEDVEADITEASKTATNYMKFEEGKGLIVGDMTGETLEKNILLDSDSVDIRNGEATLATFAAGTKEVIDPFGKTVSRDYSEVTSMYDSDFGTHKSYAAEINCHAGVLNSTFYELDESYTEGEEYNYAAETKVRAAISNPYSATESYKEALIRMFSARSTQEGIFSRMDISADYLYILAKNKLAWDIPVDTSGNCNVVTNSEIRYLGTSATNRPIAVNGWLETKAYDTGYASQIYTTYTGQFYHRIKNNGTWASWKAGLVNKHKLWNGTLSKGGSVTIQNLDLYDVFMARTSNGSAMMLGVRYYNDSSSPQPNITFFGGYDNGTKSYVLKAMGTMSSTTFTLSQCSIHELGSTGCVGTVLTIKSLWGIM